MTAPAKLSMKLFAAAMSIAVAVGTAASVHAEAKKPASSKNGKYTDKDGNPTYNITDGGKKADWYTYSGYRHYHADCHTCHGPDGMGSTYAPALANSLKTMTYAQFTEMVINGKKDVSKSSDKVMPSFGTNKNVACYLDDLYVYLKARADGAIDRGRPPEKEAKPAEAKTNEDACLGQK